MEGVNPNPLANKEMKCTIEPQCKTCKHALVCMYRSDIICLTDHIEEDVNNYTNRDPFPNSLAMIEIKCKFYETAIVPYSPCIPRTTYCCN